jgi:hypothetical protein
MNNIYNNNLRIINSYLSINDIYKCLIISKSVNRIIEKYLIINQSQMRKLLSVYIQLLKIIKIYNTLYVNQELYTNNHINFIQKTFIKLLFTYSVLITGGLLYVIQQQIYITIIDYM